MTTAWCCPNPPRYVLYLARKSGRLMPRDAAQATQVERWCFATVSSIEPPLQNVMVMDWFKSENFANFRDFAVGWVQRVLGNLDRWLEGRKFVATDGFTVADLLLAHVLEMIKDETMISPHARVVDYRDRCLSRPAWKRTLERYYARVEAA